MSGGLLDTTVLDDLVEPIGADAARAVIELLFIARRSAPAPPRRERHLRRDIPDRRNVWIIALAANAFGEDHRRCIAAGMNDFIATPVRPDDPKASLERMTAVIAARVVASGDLKPRRQQPIIGSWKNSPSGPSPTTRG